MLTILSDILGALRSLRLQPSFSTIVIAIIAVGLGATTAVFSVVDAVLLQPLNYPHPHRLFVVQGLTPKREPTQIVPAAFESFLQNSRTLESGTLIRERSLTILGDEGAGTVFAQALAADGLRVFGAEALIGRIFKRDLEREVVLSHRFWLQRYNSDPAILGRSLLLNDRIYTVSGVMPADFETTNKSVDLWIAWKFTAKELAERSSGGFRMVIRRQPGVSDDQMRAELATLGRAFNADLPIDLKGWNPTITSLREHLVGDYRRSLWVMLGAVTCLLLIACLNVACLTLARAQDEMRNVAIRLALGAGRWRVMRQLLIQSMLLSIVGSVVGLLLSVVGTRAMLVLSAERMIIPRLENVGVNAHVLLFSAITAVSTGIVFGLAPAWNLSKIDAQDGLKRAGRGFAGNHGAEFARRSGVVLQIALSVVLLAGAGLLIRSFINLLNTDPGFRADGVLTARLPSGVGQPTGAVLASRYASVLQAAEVIPGVEVVALSTVIPMGPMEATSTVMVDSPELTGKVLTAQYRAVSSQYFGAMRISVVRGRSFTKYDSENAPEVAILNDVAAQRYWPGQDPIGKRVATTFDEGKPTWIMVVGVVRGVRQNLKSEPAEELYRPYTQHLVGPHGAEIILRTTQDPRSIVEPLKATLRKTFPLQPIADIRTMDEWLRRSHVRPRFDASLLASFATAAFVIAGMGVYALVSFWVRRRWREIGVRIALGATRQDIAIMVIGHAAGLVVPGLMLGLLGSVALTRLLTSQLYGVAPTDPVTLLVACVLLCATALWASWLPASRAASMDPVRTLREE
jgi:putative ABC transport system permease protein